jgi:hypothetical protein
LEWGARLPRIKMNTMRDDEGEPPPELMVPNSGQEWIDVIPLHFCFENLREVRALA